MAIRFCGKLKNFSQLERGDCPKEAIQIEEGENMEEVLKNAFVQFVPMLILMMALSFVRLVKGLNWQVAIKPSAVFLALCIEMIIYLLLIFVHECIHALFCPKGSEKEIWFYQNQAAFVYCNGLMSRTRFVVMCLAPMTVLGFVPFILWLFLAERPAALISLVWMSLSWMMIFGGMGDFYNVKNILKQVPKDGRVFNYGFHTYWLKRK